LGVVWVLNNLNILNFRISQWWPLILIVIGLLHLVQHRRITAFGGWFLIFLGVIFLLTTNGILYWNEIWKFWPVALIFIGLSIIFERYGEHKNKASDSGEGDEVTGPSKEDRIYGAAIFGSLERKVNNKNFKGGSVSALFAGVEIDLHSADLDEQGAVLSASAVFGGVEIRIPESWAIEIRSTAILGGVSNKGGNEEKTSGKRLVINASAIFGGVEIKN
jgi:predicted membrane protein